MEQLSQNSPINQSKTYEAQPFVKWAGGKGQMLSAYSRYFPEEFSTYHEPFLGGGAVFFHLQPERAILTDINAELMNVYRSIRDHLEELIDHLEWFAEMHKEYGKMFYLFVRALPKDKDDEGQELTLKEARGGGFDPEAGDLLALEGLAPVERAARFIYLNRTCYNGLYRVNSRGEFNVPMGRYKNPKILRKKSLQAVNRVLTRGDVELHSDDYKRVLEDAGEGDFVYFDPPYHPLDDTSNFTSYTQEGFGKKQQKELEETMVELTMMGCLVMLSNSSADWITEHLYTEKKGYRIVELSGNRSINRDASKRGEIAEILVMNYDPRGNLLTEIVG